MYFGRKLMNLQKLAVDEIIMPCTANNKITKKVIKFALQLC